MLSVCQRKMCLKELQVWSRFCWALMQHAKHTTKNCMRANWISIEHCELPPNFAQWCMVMRGTTRHCLWLHSTEWLVWNRSYTTPKQQEQSTPKAQITNRNIRINPFFGHRWCSFKKQWESHKQHFPCLDQALLQFWGEKYFQMLRFWSWGWGRGRRGNFHIFGIA